MSINNRVNKSKYIYILRTVYFSVILEHIKKNGIIWAIKKILTRCAKELAWILLLPIAIGLHFMGFRRILFRIEHIGHLAAECDSFVKEMKLGLLTNKGRLFFIVAPRSVVSNVHLLKCWKPYFNIIVNPYLCVILMLLTRRYYMRYDVSRYISSFFGTQEIYKINKLWGNRSSVLNLNEEDQSWGRQQLLKLGVLPDQWFVCLHVREGGFLPHNELIQSHRNASIFNTIEAIQEIISRGGVVVRMGDPSMTPLPKMDNVIDYAHHSLKSDRLDVILCAKAKFFVGCTSGLALVSMIFGVPIAQVNMVPMAALGIRSVDISIPKLIFNESTKHYLQFKDIMMSDVGSFYFTHQYKNAGLSCIENTSGDIHSLVCEMMDRLDGTFFANDEDQKLQMKYLSLFRPGHYSYGAESRVGAAFLRKYKNLLM